MQNTGVALRAGAMWVRGWQFYSLLEHEVLGRKGQGAARGKQKEGARTGLQWSSPGSPWKVWDGWGTVTVGHTTFQQ